ncbi:MAG: hypothetical protein LQ350_002781 [Teloschistes chrysophthalmus]|nr:MAG: hypothetical protein LQ350_002781 [Niorma chrysophthalma]
MAHLSILSVDRLTALLKELLARAKGFKPDGRIEPALTAASFQGDVEILTKQAEGGVTVNPQDHYAALETACRNIFYELLASTSIQDPSFGQIWDLLDIVSILSDIPLCEPGLVFWLVEELLDSQTIDGCRIVFDYLDSRRERLTAKNFKQKQLIILRACNELLRRLSRAEDTVFCGRVFIFMFQSFPLGDRSSVNLRGEYHVENITAFEKGPVKDEEKSGSVMDVDHEMDAVEKEKTPVVDPPIATEANKDAQTVQPAETTAKTVKFDAPDETLKETQPKPESEPEPDPETLYPIFWSLQDVFSQPIRLFESQFFSSFKSGLDLTLRKFKAVQQQQQSRSTSKTPSEAHRPLKRKRADTDQSDQQQDLASSFNPRYLTSRDLFSLELSDLAFRRHILVQALILIDFLLSLTPKAKKKLGNTSNKSVLYAYTLPEEEIAWATTMRTEIATYLQQGQEGKFYYRMVDTVLSRDKNWVHWKAEGCPLIRQPPISAPSFLESQRGALKASASRRIRPSPLGSLDLAFLSNTGEEGQAMGLEKLKERERYELPRVEDFKGPILEDEFDWEMAREEKEKEEVAVRKASKMWRALRIASKSKLNLFDKIEEGGNLAVFWNPPAPEKSVEAELKDDDKSDEDEVAKKRKIDDESSAEKENQEAEKENQTVQVNGIKEEDVPMMESEPGPESGPSGAMEVT